MTLRLLIATSLAACAAFADENKVAASDWKVDIASGEWSDPANWSNGLVPADKCTAAKINVSRAKSGIGTEVLLPDATNHINYLHLLHVNPSAITLNGKGRTFSMGELSEGDFARGLNDNNGSFYPFRIMSESTSSSSALDVERTDATNGHLEPVLEWRDALLRTSSQAPRSIKLDFISGLFDFNVGGCGKWIFNFAPHPISRAEALVSNATIKCATANMSLAATNSSFAVLEGGCVELHGNFKYGNQARYDYAGTNSLAVKDGGRIVGVASGNAPEFAAGSVLGPLRRHEIEFAGNETAIDLVQFAGCYFEGNTSVKISDGVDVAFPVVIGLGKTALSRKEEMLCDMLIEGDDSVVGLPTEKDAKFNVGDAAYASNRVVMTGGRIRPLHPSGTGSFSINIANGPASDALFDMRGGDIDLWVTNNGNPYVNCGIKIGPGNGELRVSGGHIFCGDINVGKNQEVNKTEGTLHHTQRFRMTGGTVTCNRLYLGTSSNSEVVRKTFQYQDAYVDLDGGVLEASHAFVNSSALFDSTGYAHGYLTADGGTIKARYGNQNIIQDFDTAELGPKGLSVDVANLAISISQSFSDKNGERGTLRLCGTTGSVTLKPDRYHTVSTTVVDKVSLLFASNTTLRTTLVIANGGTVKLEGDVDELTVDGMAASNGTLAIDPGDAVRVRGTDISVDGLKIKFSSTPASGQLLDVFAFDGDVTSDLSVKRALRKLKLDSAPSGNYGHFSMSYDEATGKTMVSVSVEKESAPLGDSAKTVWNGPEWNSSGWSAGVPSAASLASFSNPGASPDVVVPSKAEVGAIEVSSGVSYALSGEGLSVSSVKGASFLNVTSGSVLFDVQMELLYVLPLSLSAGTEVSFMKPILFGGIEKTGKGRLILGAANQLTEPLVVGGGRNVVAAPGALPDSGTTLTDDTVEFMNAVDGTAMTVTSPFVLKSSESPTNALVVKTDSDVRFDDFSVSKGALVKCGAGTMTVRASKDKETVLFSGLGVGSAANNVIKSNTEVLEFADDGSAPDVSGGQYAGFSVAEGAVVVSGEDGDKEVDLSTAVCVGLNVSGDSGTFVQPSLTFDNVKVRSVTSGHWMIGQRLNAPGVAVHSPALCAIGGSDVECGNIRVGEDAIYDGAFPVIAATNSSVHSLNSISFYARGSQPGSTAVRLRFRDSKLGITGTGGGNHGFKIHGDIDADFDNSFFGGINDAGILHFNDYSRGEMSFRNGSVFSVGKMCQDTGSASRRVDFVFDNAEWRWGDGDMTLFLLASGAYNNEGAGLRSTRHVIMSGTGIVLKPGAGNTFATEVPFEGEGGLVCDGEGTVKFMNGSYQFGGLLDIRSGTVDISQAGAISAVQARGSGVLKGGDIGTLTLKANFADGVISGVPVLDGTKADVAIVDLGLAADAILPPLAECRNMLVATYPAGSKPQIRKWKIANAGSVPVNGRFTAADGEVRITFWNGLFRVIVR